MAYFVKSKSEWLQTLKDCINEYGLGGNIQSKKILYLLTDYNSEVQSTESTQYLKATSNKIVRQYTIQTCTKLNRTIYTINTKHVTRSNDVSLMPSKILVLCSNTLCKTGSIVSRNERFSGEKPDMSICIPFYSHGWAAITEEEREIQPGVKLMKEKATQVIMLG